MKVAFMDRDGTIISDYPDTKWTDVVTPEFFSDAFEVMFELQKRGYEIIIVTNQYLIGERYITEQQYTEFTQKMQSRLLAHSIHVLDIFYCPHSRTDKCVCCKPAPGLIHKALDKYPEIDLRNSFFIGDTVADIGIAAHFDLPIYYLGNAHNTQIYGKVRKITSLTCVLNDLQTEYRIGR